MKTWLRLNWLTVLDIAKTIMIGALLIIGINGLTKSVAQSKQTAQLGQQNKILIKRTNTLEQENNDLQKQLGAKTDAINAHVDCIVALFLPTKPLPTDADIEGCKATPQTQSSPTTAPNKTNTAPETNKPPQSVSPSSGGGPSGDNNKTPDSNKPNILQRTVKNIMNKL